jgi:hypothetical protein
MTFFLPAFATGQRLILYGGETVEEIVIGIAMLVRITRTIQDCTTVLQVDGGLFSEFVPEMTRECDSLDEAFILDLTNLYCIDAAGAAMLAELACKGVEIRGASPYITLRIQQQLPLPIAQTPPSPKVETSRPWFAELPRYGTLALVGE